MSRTRAARTGAWSIALQLIRLGSQAIVFLLFSRILPLADLGAYSFAYAFVQLAQTLVRSGVIEVVVASDREDANFMGSALLVSLAIGATMSIALFAIALVFGLLSSASAPILFVLAAVPLIDSLSVVPEAVLRRRLDFGKIAARTTASLSLASIVCLLMGYAGWGVWALVLFNVTASLASTAIVVAMVRRHLPKETLTSGSKGTCLGVARPAANIAASTLATGAIVPISQIALGIFAGTSAVGAYAIAQRILSLINAVLIEPVRVATLPVLSRIKDLKKRTDTLLEVLGVSATLIAPICLGTAALSPTLFPWVLGQNGQQAFPIFSVLAFHFVPLLVSMTTGQLLLLHGRSKEMLRYTSVMAGMGVLASLAVSSFGAVAVAIAYVARAYLLMPLALRQARRYGNAPGRKMLSKLAPPMIAAFTMAVAAYGFSAYLASVGITPFWLLAAASAFSAAFYVALMAAFARDHLRAILRLATSMTGRRSAINQG